MIKYYILIGSFDTCIKPKRYCLNCTYNTSVRLSGIYDKLTLYMKKKSLIINFSVFLTFITESHLFILINFMQYKIIMGQLSGYTNFIILVFIKEKLTD